MRLQPALARDPTLTRDDIERAAKWVLETVRAKPTIGPDYRAELIGRYGFTEAEVDGMFETVRDA